MQYPLPQELQLIEGNWDQGHNVNLLFHLNWHLDTKKSNLQECHSKSGTVSNAILYPLYCNYAQNKPFSNRNQTHFSIFTCVGQECLGHQKLNLASTCAFHFLYMDSCLFMSCSIAVIWWSWREAVYCWNTYTGLLAAQWHGWVIWFCVRLFSIRYGGSSITGLTALTTPQALACFDKLHNWLEFKRGDGERPKVHFALFILRNSL